MKNTETIIDRNDLFDYLNSFLFSNNEEIEMAICDYIEKQEWCLYRSDCSLATELANEFINKKELYDIEYL